MSCCSWEDGTVGGRVWPEIVARIVCGLTRGLPCIAPALVIMQLLWLSKNVSSGNKCTQNTQVLLSLVIFLGEQDLLKHEATCVVDSIYFHVFYHKISKLKSNHLKVFDNETVTRPRWEALHPAVPKVFLCAAARRRVKVRLKSQHSPCEKHYDTRAHTNMVHTREAKHAETFLWIDLDGRSILLRSSQ